MQFIYCTEKTSLAPTGAKSPQWNKIIFHEKLDEDLQQKAGAKIIWNTFVALHEQLKSAITKLEILQESTPKL